MERLSALVVESDDVEELSALIAKLNDEVELLSALIVKDDDAVYKLSDIIAKLNYDVDQLSTLLVKGDEANALQISEINDRLSTLITKGDEANALQIAELSTVVDRLSALIEEDEGDVRLPEKATLGQFLKVSEVNEMGEIIALDAVSLCVPIPLTQEEYDALKEAGTIEKDALYMIVDEDTT